MIVHFDEKALTEAFDWMRERVLNGGEPLQEITKSEEDCVHRRYAIFATQFFYDNVPRMGETVEEKLQTAQTLARSFLERGNDFDLFVSS